MVWPLRHCSPLHQDTTATWDSSSLTLAPVVPTSLKETVLQPTRLHVFSAHLATTADHRALHGISLAQRVPSALQDPHILITALEVTTAHAWRPTRSSAQPDTIAHHFPSTRCSVGTVRTVPQQPKSHCSVRMVTFHETIPLSVLIWKKAARFARPVLGRRTPCTASSARLVTFAWEEPPLLLRPTSRLRTVTSAPSDTTAQLVAARQLLVQQVA
jgi:hypothetical protein